MSERTVEIPAFIEHLKHQNFPSLIDIGSHNTAFYAKYAARLVTGYIGMDPLGPGDEEFYLDKIYACKPWLTPTQRIANTVSCISVLEHCDHEEQLKICVKINWMANRSIFLSFPFGRGSSDTHTDITPDILHQFCEWTINFEHKTHYYMTEDDPNGFHQVWLPVSQGVAAQQEYDPDRGVHCVCILEGFKK